METDQVPEFLKSPTDFNKKAYLEDFAIQKDMENGRNIGFSFLAYVGDGLEVRQRYELREPDVRRLDGFTIRKVFEPEPSDIVYIEMQNLFDESGNYTPNAPLVYETEPKEWEGNTTISDRSHLNEFVIENIGNATRIKIRKPDGSCFYIGETSHSQFEAEKEKFFERALERLSNGAYSSREKLEYVMKRIRVVDEKSYQNHFEYADLLIKAETEAELKMKRRYFATAGKIHINREWVLTP